MRIIGSILIAVPLMAGACKKSGTDADNTKRNKVVETTADKADQSGAAVDQMAKIRKALVADDTLSTNAKNVKVIVNGTTVTLEGAVDNTDEKARVNELASASGLTVVNNLQVTN
ncbi:MAG: BON domain-containing protein [Kofleriaceae bacterium]